MADKIKGITIEIDGDTTKLSKALKDLNSKLKQSQSNLKDIDKLLRFDPGNTTLLQQKYKYLGDEIEATKEKLKALKQAESQAVQALAKGDITEQEFEDLQREIVETEQKLQGLTQRFDEFGSVSAQRVAAAGEKMKTVGSSVENTGKKMSVVSAGITAVGVASGKMAVDFEDAMAKVSTIADTSEVSMDELERAILDLSNQTGISSADIAQNVYDAISAGQKTGDAVNFVTKSSMLAKAGFADAGAALDVLTTIMNAYGLEADKVAEVSDTLIQTQNLGKTTVGQLASSMGKIIPTANAYGVQLDQLCAGYALMTANGVATAESTTYMNAMLNELGKSGTGVAKILKEKTGLSFAELMEQGYSLSDVLAIIEQSAKEQGLAFTDMWSSSEAAKAGLITLGDSAEKFNGVLGQMQQSTGATDSAFEKLKTNSYNIQLTINKLKNTAIELGTALMQVLAPIFVALAEKVSALAQWFSGLSESQKNTIVTIALVVAAIGPLLVIIGKAISVVGTIMTAVPKIVSGITAIGKVLKVLWVILSANPIGLVIAAIAALVAGFLYLWENCEGFREFWINLWNKLKEIVSAAVNVIKNVVSSAINGINLAITTGLTAAKDVVTNILGGIKNAFSNVWNGVKSIVSGAISKIKSLLDFDWELPKLKLPHFSIKGEFSLDPPSIPHIGVDWYRKAMNDGMILNSPTIFGAAGGKLLGAGEAGPEAVVGASSLRGMIQDAVAAAGAGGVGDIIIPVYVGQERIDEIVLNATQRSTYRSGGR